MGIRKSSRVRTVIPIPLRLDKLARDLCKCGCHIGEDNPHLHKACPCIPKYVDGHAISVVESSRKEVP